MAEYFIAMAMLGGLIVTVTVSVAIGFSVAFKILDWMDKDG